MYSMWKTLSHKEKVHPGPEGQPPGASSVLEAHLD